MREVDKVSQPGSANTYERVHIQLAADYKMCEFHQDLAGQPTPLYGFHIWSPCPRCGHLSSGLVPAKFLPEYPTGEPLAIDPSPDPSPEGLSEGDSRIDKAELAASGDGGTARPLRQGYKGNAAVLTCHCTKTHDHKNGNIGCGAEWMLAFEYSPDHKKVVLSPVPDLVAARTWIAADAVSASIATAGQVAMGQASKWVTVFTSAVGIITLGGVLGGRSTIQGLNGWWQFAIGAAALIALAADAVMIYQGNVAGRGYPALKRVLSDRTLIEADIQPLKDADDSIRRLDHARFWAKVTGFATLAAVGMFIFAPVGNDHVKVKYTGDNGVVYQTSCGVLAADKTGTLTSFKPEHGPKIGLSKATMIAVDAC